MPNKQNKKPGILYRHLYLIKKLVNIGSYGLSERTNSLFGKDDDTLRKDSVCVFSFCLPSIRQLQVYG